VSDDTRDVLVDLVLLGVAAVAVSVVVRNPSLRRATWRLLKYGLFTAAPTYLWQETTRAWAETGTRTRNPEPEPGTGTVSKPAIIDA
jgi:hypothetical protein